MLNLHALWMGTEFYNEKQKPMNWYSWSIKNLPPKR